MMKKNKSSTLKIDPFLYDDFMAHCTKTGISLSEAVRQLMRRVLAGEIKIN